MNGLYIPNKMGRIFLLALEETLGEEGLQIVLARAGLRDLTDFPPDNLERAFPVPWVPRLTTAMEDLYGVREGRNLSFRAGQACFRLG
ncbi:MAG: 4-vinyl reductase, partial [Thermoflexia bacterium]